MVTSVVHGSRAKLSINGKPVGIFNNVSYSVNYDTNPIHILGRFSPQEIVLSGQDAITVQASGFRVIDKGPYAIEGANMPVLDQLLNAEDINLSLTDRQTKKDIMKVVGVKASSFSSTVAARGVTEIQVTFVGIRFSDEEGPQNEAGGGDSAPVGY